MLTHLISSVLDSDENWASLVWSVVYSVLHAVFIEHCVHRYLTARPHYRHRQVPWRGKFGFGRSRA